MYNRYIPNGTGYTRIWEKEESEEPVVVYPQSHPVQSIPRKKKMPVPKGIGLDALLKGFKIGEFDSGDFLLLLILLLLLKEGEEIELVVALAVVLFWNFGDQEKEQ